MSGKGSAPRPIPNLETFANNWELAFGNPENNKSKKHKKCSRCGQYFETAQASSECEGVCPEAPIH